MIKLSRLRLDQWGSMWSHNPAKLFQYKKQQDITYLGINKFSFVTSKISFFGPSHGDWKFIQHRPSRFIRYRTWEAPNTHTFWSFCVRNVHVFSWGGLRFWLQLKFEGLEGGGEVWVTFPKITACSWLMKRWQHSHWFQCIWKKQL